MKDRIMYIEHKTDQNDRGNAWIGKVEFSKTGQTIYFNGRAFKKCRTGGTLGNFYDLETGDEYWISGVKKNGQDRHCAGGGKIKIEQSIIDEYLNLVDFEELGEQEFEPVKVEKTNKLRFQVIENDIHD